MSRLAIVRLLQRNLFALIRLKRLIIIGYATSYKLLRSVVGGEIRTHFHHSDAKLINFDTTINITAGQFLYQIAQLDSPD